MNNGVSVSSNMAAVCEGRRQRMYTHTSREIKNAELPNRCNESVLRDEQKRRWNLPMVPSRDGSCRCAILS